MTTTKKKNSQVKDGTEPVKRKRGRPQGVISPSKLSRYLKGTNAKSVYRTTAEIFGMFDVLKENDMNNSKTARLLDLSVDTVRAYRSKYWHEYEAKIKIDKEEAERRARVALIPYDEPEELTVEVIDNTVDKVRNVISDSLLLSMDEIKRRLTDPVERNNMSSKDIIAHVSNLLPFLAFKIGEYGGNNNDDIKKTKDEFMQKFIETMTNHKQKGINE